jgi:hypothetical protein
VRFLAGSRPVLWPRPAQAAAGWLGAEPAAPANPYWAEHGLTFEDPDGFRVVLVPERWEP